MIISGRLQVFFGNFYSAYNKSMSQNMEHILFIVTVMQYSTSTACALADMKEGNYICVPLTG